MENSDFEAKKEKKQQRQRKTTKHALTNVGIETLIKILKTYVVGTKNGESPIDYRSVASISGVSPYTVSGCNKFFEENGMLILKKRGLYKPTQEIINFSRDLPWDTEGAKRSLRNVLKKTWFGELIIQKYQLHASYSETKLINSLGREAGALDDQTPSLKRLIDILEYSEIIQKNEDNNYVLTLDYSVPKKPSTAKTTIPLVRAERDMMQRETKSEVSSSGTKEHPRVTSYQINLNISVPENINDKYIESLENLLKRLKSLTN